MNILSCFDGISCGQLALNRAKVKYNNYFSSEINKHAIAITQCNFPKTIQLGDINDIDINDLPNIDLLIGGSPCQGFSFSGLGLNFNDSRSKLFFKFAELIEKLKPKYFLLENVIMKKEYQDIISSYLGIEPMMINSSLVSAQNRKRLYWTNLPIISEIEDLDIKIDDILEYDKDKNLYCAAMRGRYLINNIRQDMKMKTKGLTTQRLEVRFDKKTNTLTTVQKDNVLVCNPKDKYYPINGIEWRHLTPVEYERLQTIPDNYTKFGYYDKNIKVVPKTHRYSSIGNGWTVDVISKFFNCLNE